MYCGSTENITCEHIIPVSRGGTNAPDNLGPACVDCQLAKSDRLVFVPRVMTSGDDPAVDKRR